MHGRLFSCSTVANVLRDLQETLQDWPATRQTAKAREGVTLAWKLHHAVVVVRPGRYFVRRLPHLDKIRLNGLIGSGGSGGGRNVRRRQRRRGK